MTAYEAFESIYKKEPQNQKELKPRGEDTHQREKNKKKEKGLKSTTEIMRDVCSYLPQLIRAEKVQKKAAKVGFDWDEADGAFEKIAEETAELREAYVSGDAERIEDELGDLLFSVVNVSRFVEGDAEKALTHSCDKFVARFRIVEELAAERGIDMPTAGLEVLDKLWDEAKKSL